VASGGRVPLVDDDPVELVEVVFRGFHVLGVKGKDLGKIERGLQLSTSTRESFQVDDEDSGD